jgi:hypothetical protein
MIRDVHRTKQGEKVTQLCFFPQLHFLFPKLPKKVKLVGVWLVVRSKEMQ